MFGDTFEEMEREFERMRNMSIDELRILKIALSVEYESGKYTLEAFSKISPLILSAALLAGFYSQITSEITPLIIAVILIVIYMTAFTWTYLRRRRSKIAFRKLGIVEIALEEKTKRS